MTNQYKVNHREALEEARRTNPDDLLAFGSRYFVCGYKPLEAGCYYNSSISIAFEIIGMLCCEERNGVSNYRKGIDYIANSLKISKRQVKVLRKQFAGRGGYVFKTPYSIPSIINTMVELLHKNESTQIVIDFFNQHGDSVLYRDALIEEQYYAIKSSAKYDNKIKTVYGDLKTITKRWNQNEK